MRTKSKRECLNCGEKRPDKFYIYDAQKCKKCKLAAAYKIKHNQRAISDKSQLKILNFLSFFEFKKLIQVQKHTGLERKNILHFLQALKNRGDVYHNKIDGYKLINEIADIELLTFNQEKKEKEPIKFNWVWEFDPDYNNW